MGKTSSAKGIKDFTSISGLDVVIDTNVLIFIFSEGNNQALKKQRAAVTKFLTQNRIFITDTVYWEFLRNTNIGNFRKRNKHLIELTKVRERNEEIINEGLPLLDESKPEVCDVFADISTYHLFEHRNNLKKFFHSKPEDRWVMATAITYLVDNVLTFEREGNDFPMNILNTQEFNLGNKKFMRLHTYDNDKEQRVVDEIINEGGIHIAF